MPLNLSNNIESQTEIRAAEHEQNYTEIENYVNSQLLHADGSVPIANGVQLILGAAGASPSAAVTKQQLDDAITAFNSAITDTEQGAASAGHDHSGTYAEVGHNHSGTYASAGHSHDFTNLRLVAPERIRGNPVDSVSASETQTITVPATVGGVSSAGAVGVFMNIQVVQPTGSGYLRVRSTADSFTTSSALNYQSGVTIGGLVLCKLNASRQFQVRAEAGGMANMMIDVYGLVF